MVEAVESFLGCALVRFLLAVAHGVAGVDAAQDDCRAEDGVLVGVAVGVHKFKLDGYAVLLCPLDEARLEILFGLYQIVEVEVLFYQAVDDKLAAALVALVEIDRTHECLEGIAADVAVV